MRTARPALRPTACPRVVLLIALISLLPHPGWAANSLSYTVRIAPVGNDALAKTLTGASQLVALRTQAPVGPFALVGRARQDEARWGTVLESVGYYDSKIKITIDGHALDDASLPDTLGALPAQAEVVVDVRIEKGPLFHLGQVRLEGQIPPALRGEFRLAPGTPAVAAAVLGAGAKLLTALQEHGYAQTSVPAPEATLVAPSHTIDVTYHVASGPRVDLGRIEIAGLKHVHEAYVRRRLELHQGELYQPSKIEAAREDLLATGVFKGVRISTVPPLTPDGRLDLLVDVSERKRFTVAFNASFSTDLGGSAGVTWTDHNLFGNAESLALTADATGLGGSASSGIGYLAQAQLTKPDFYHRDQTLSFNLEAIKQNLDTYDQTAEIAGVALSRKLNSHWTVSAGVTGTQEQILQEAVTRDYTLLALPITGRFDDTDVAQPFDDPSHGVRVALLVTPTQSFSTNNATFVILQGTASTYIDLHRLGWSAPGRSVLALRGLVGSAQGAGEFDLPPDQRFYAGGSATVRGYKYQSAGPLFPDGTPEGGTAIDAATIELRQRLWKKFGAVLFADAAQVTTRGTPFSGAVQEGVGVGARYYTSIGPIRLDFAVPMKQPRGGDSFEIYIGLGEAF